MILRLIYGTGMRILEALRLRVKDIDFGRNEILIREAKGFNLETAVGRSRVAHGVGVT